MQHRRLTVTMAVAVCAMAIAACGGGSNPTPPVSGPTPTPAPTPAAQQQQPVNSASGGTISASIPGGGTLAVQVPANSLSANATVTIYAYTSLSQMNVAASGTSVSAKPRHAHVSVPNNGVFLAGFAIDTGSASVLVPLAVTETLQASVPSGDVVRVARLGKSGNFTDVDTATVSGSNATNDVNAKYVSVSGGGTAAPYILYAIPSSAAATPAPIALNAQSPLGQQIVIGATGTFTASGADANGNPLPFTPAFDTDNHTIATVATGTTPFTAVVTATTQGGVLDLLVSDSRTKTTGKIPFTVYTQRPANAGNTFAFSGSLTQNDTFAYPLPTLPPTSVTANVTQNVNVSATANPYSSGSVQDFNVVETDAFPTQTYKTTTDYYYQLASANFELLGYSAVDDQGNTTAVQYGTPQIVDELPEAANASWTNSPAMTLTQTFAGQETASRTVNADGTYTDTENAYQGTGSSTYPATTIILHDNADGSANMTFTFNWTGSAYNPPYTTSTFTWSETAPYVPSPAPSQSPGPAVIGVYEASTVVQSTPAPSPSPRLQLTLNQWYPSALQMYNETDKNLGSVTIPSTCNVPSGLGTTAMHLQQQVNRWDTAIGSSETTTTDSYVVTGFGPVCVQVSDKTDAYYDFQNDTGYNWYFSSVPMQTTNVSEMLTLQTTGTSTTPQYRSGASVAQLQPVSPAAVAFAREHVQLIAQHNRMARLRNISQRIVKAIVRGGLH